MAQYLVLIYENEESWANVDEATYGRIHAEHNDFGKKHGASLRGGNALEPSMTATSIRKNASGEPVTTDGPSRKRRKRLAGTTSSRPTTSTPPSPSPRKYRPILAALKFDRFE